MRIGLHGHINHLKLRLAAVFLSVNCPDVEDTRIWHRLLTLLERPCCLLGEDSLASIILTFILAGLMLGFFNQPLCKVLLVHTLVKRIENAVRLSRREHHALGASRDTLIVSTREFLSD